MRVSGYHAVAMSLPAVDDLLPITSAAAMSRRWRRLLGDGRFGGRELWLAVLDAGHRQLPVLPVVDELPDRVDPAFCAGIARTAAAMMTEHGAARFALALSRPGPSRATGDDEAWAGELPTALGRVGVPLLSLHLATRAHVRVLG